MVKEVTDETFDDFINTDDVAVIDCWAAWCGPCHILSPIIEQLSKENERVIFGKLDVDQNRVTPMKYGIMSIPTLLYFKEGKLVERTIGALPKKMIENKLENILRLSK